MNTVDYFYHYEQDNNRGDKYEGTSFILESSNIELSIGAQKIAHSNSGIINTRNQIDNGNLYCLTALWSEDKQAFDEGRLEMDTRLTELGDSFVFIYNPREFWKRLIGAIEEARIKYSYHAVEYRNVNEVNGRWGIFSKPLEYSFQREIRVFLVSEGNEPIPFQLGCLEDIAQIFDIEEFFMKK